MALLTLPLRQLNSTRFITNDAAALSNSSVTLGTVSDNQAAVATNAAKVANNGVTSITFATDDVFTTAVTNNAGAFAAGSVSLSNNAIAGATDIAAVVNNRAKLADNQVTSISLTQTQLNTIAGSAGADLDNAFTANSITISEAITNADAKATLLANGDKIANNGITGITLTDGELKTFVDNNTNNPLADSSVTLGSVTGNQSDVITNIAKVVDGGITAITLSETQLNTAAGSAGANLDDAFAANSITIGAVTDGSNAETTVLANTDKIADDGITAITLTAAQFATVVGADAAALKAASVTLGTVSDNQGTVASNAAKLATNGVGSITFATDDVFTTAVTNNAAGFTNGGVSLGNKAIADTNDIAAVVANHGKLADNQVTSITLTETQLNTVAGGAGNDLDDAFAGDSITIGAVTDGSDAETTVLANTDKIAADGITAITLTAAQFATVVGADAAALKSGSVTLGTVSDNQGTIVNIANLAKLATDGVTSITLSQTQLNTAANGGGNDLSNAFAADSITMGEAVTDNDTKSTLVNNADKIADNGITSITLNDTQFNTLITNGTAAPFQNGSVTLGTVTGNQGTVATNAVKLATNGVGSITFATDDVFTTAVTNNAAGFTNGGVSLGNKAIADTNDIAAVVANHAKLADSQVTSITLTEAQYNTVSGGGTNNLDDAFADNSITIGAVSDATVKTNLLANTSHNGDKIADNGITSISLTTAEFVAFIGANTNAPFQNAAVTLGTVSANQADVVTNIAKVAAGGIGSVTLTGTQYNTMSSSAAALADEALTLNVGASETLNFSSDANLAAKINTVSIASGGSLTLSNAQATAHTITGNGSLTVTGVVDGVNLTNIATGLTHTINLADTTNISSNTTLSTVDSINLENNAKVTMTKAQHDLLNVGAAGVGNDNKITMSAGASFNAESTVETYQLANAVNSITLSASGHTVLGGTAVDTVLGGESVDKIQGKGGLDLLTGGGGADQFILNSSATLNNGNANGSDAFTDVTSSSSFETISDFTSGEDKILLKDGNGNDITVTELVTFHGNVSFASQFAQRLTENDGFDGTGVDAFLMYNVAGTGVGYLAVDVDGDGSLNNDGDIVLALTGVSVAGTGTANDDLVIGDFAL